MFAQEHHALDWFYKALKFEETIWLYTLIAGIRERGAHEHYYQYWKRSSADAHARLIVVPEPFMMFVHQKIKAFLISEFDRKPWSFGFMGGSAEEAAHVHKHNRSFLRFDIRHAFFQIGHDEVLKALSKRPTFGKRHYGTVSKWVARFIADLCTIQAWPEVEARYNVSSFLPQGSPTSPILFDIALEPFDEQMIKIANRTGGTFTRYADNIVFSMPDRKFPPKLRRAILQEAIGGHNNRSGHPIHKVSQSNERQPFQMLGLQIADHRVLMTRQYKRKLRGSLYHLQHAAEVGTLDERTINIARGRLSFAVMDDMSASLALAAQAANDILGSL